MENFIFHNPTKLFFGRGQTSGLGEELFSKGFRKVLLIAGSGSIKEKNSCYREVTDSLIKSGIEWVECWGVRPNPELSKVKSAMELARKNDIDAVLGVGGGSVIDTAKAVAAGFYADDVWDLFKNKTIVEKALPVLTVLTLSGTGTEMNPFAVITKEDSLHKWNIKGPALYPLASFVDPSFQKSLSWQQTACGAVDAISHIMEFYFTEAFSVTTLSLSGSLIKSIIRSADELKENPGSYQARSDLAWASTLALNGTSGAGLGWGDWSAHYIEHALSAYRPEISHGEGLGVIFPAWIEYVYEKTNARNFQTWAAEVWGVDSLERGVRAFRNKLRQWGMPLGLKDLKVEKGLVKEIADKALEYGELGALRVLKAKDIETVLKKSYSV